MQGHKIIVAGASAGGVEILLQLARELPVHLPASVFLVLHIPADTPSLLPALLQRVCALHVQHPVDYQKIEVGNVYVAPPDHHLLVKEGYMRVVRGPRENRHRPAIDPLFRSAALAYGPQVIGIVLTGGLDDGTAGLQAIKQQKGIAIVQDPHEAMYPGMPRSALEQVAVDYCMPVAEIGPLLVRLANEPVQSQEIEPAPKEMEQEVRIVEMKTPPQREPGQPGEPSAFSCPECGGVLWEIHDGNLVRFRCRTGHAFSVDSMLAEQGEQIEQALWVALKTLEERADLSYRMAAQSRKNGHYWLAETSEKRAREAEQHAHVLRRVLSEKNTNELSANGSV